MSESMAPSGEDTFPLLIGVATLRTAEREHPVNFRLLETSSTVIVEPFGAVVNPLYDAVFGSRLSIDDPIEEFFVLNRLEDTIPSLMASIRREFRPEEVECFTIRVFPVDVPGRPELFMCNEDSVGATNYFCETEICIEDNDDGKYFYIDHLS